MRLASVFRYLVPPVLRSTLMWRGLASALLIAPCSLAAVPGDEPSWLHWAPPPECPKADYIAAQVAEWLGGPVPTDSGLEVDAQLTWTGARWEVSVNVAFDGSVGERRVAVDSCTEAADFVAVSVVLAVDPSLAETLPLDESSEPEPYDSPTPSPQEANAEADVPKREASSAGEKPRPRSSSPTFTPHVQVGGEALWVSLPEAQLGVSVGGGVRLGRLTTTLGGHFLPPDATSTEATLAPISFSLLTARLSAEHHWELGRLVSVGPSLSIEGGGLFAEQRGAETRSAEQAWLAAAPGVSVTIRLARRFSLLGQLEAVVPLLQPSLVLSDGSLLHDVGPGARASAGVRVFFGEQ